MSSGLYVPTWVAMATGNLNLDLDLASNHNLALFNSSLNINFNTDTTYGVGEYASNEVTGTGWAAGGVGLEVAASGGTSTAPSLASSGDGLVAYRMSPVSVAGVTVSGIRYLVAYADALSNELWALWDLGADFGVHGTLRVFTPAAGLISWRLAPPVT